MVESRGNNKKHLSGSKNSKGSKSSNPKNFLTLIACTGLLGFLFGAVPTVKAQSHPTGNLKTITLEQARERAVKNYPKIQSAALEIKNQEALKKTAWNLGNTTLFTEEEEVGNGLSGVQSQGIQQRQIDVFGIVPRLQLQKEQVALAEDAFNLSMIEVEREVSQAWALTYAAKNKYHVYERLSTIFADIERAARIRLEVEATSKLEYLATANQGNQVEIQKEQAYRDYLSALQQLNLWFVNDAQFTVPDIPPDQLENQINFAAGSLESHPEIKISKQQINVADAAIKEKRSQFLPKFNLQYSRQEIAGQSGFHQFQAGVQIPLFFGPELGRTQSAKIQRTIAAQNLQQTQLELNAAYQSVREQYLKWLNSWQYYRDAALPMAKEQQTGAVFAYKEGAIDYVTFLQNMREAIRIEVDSWDALGNLLDTRYQLEYYLETSN